jgi:hypothetical protein
MSIQKTITAHTNNSNSSFNNSMLERSKIKLSRFIGSTQLDVINLLCQGEERQFYYDKLVELANIVETMPVTYQTDGQGDQAIIQLHYFTPSADFYITERDCEDKQLQAFGKADLGYGAELGYISIVEILRNGAELDLHWQPKKLCVI